MHAIKLVTLAALSFGVSAPITSAAPLRFEITFDKSVSEAPFTGRVFVLFTKLKSREPRRGVNWFRPEPILAKDVKNWQPGRPIILDGSALSFPEKLSKLEAREWSVQAVMDFDRGYRRFSNAPGNGYSKAVRQKLDPSSSGALKLTINQIVPEPTFKETERVKLAVIESKLLSKFHGRTVKMRAGVILPESYGEDPKRRYPIIYNVPGFGGDHTTARRRSPSVTDVAGTEFLYVVLDPNCRWGHHVFADSANNGPCGQALVRELIPFIEKKFRAIGKSSARFVTGHSSGGWSSLWLQVAYPDFFGGCWSTAPDPVDFRDFQLVDVYKPKNNVYYDAKGELRPLSRSVGGARLTYKTFSGMEEIIGHGGQLGSFEAVFGPRGKDGRPMPLWDRRTGAIDPRVAKAWEQFDIRLVIERNWKSLGPKLKGKLHVHVGDKDTFYLEGAVRLLQQSLKRLGSDAVVEIAPGKTHGSLLDKKLRERIAREMAQQYGRSNPAAR